MRFNFIGFKLSLLLTVVAIHSSVKEFLYRVPFFLWLTSVLILIPLLSPFLQRKLVEKTPFFDKKPRIFALSIIFFATFLQMINSNSLDNKFEAVSKFLQFFDETKVKMLKHYKNLAYIQPLSNELSKPKISLGSSDERFRFFFGGSLVESNTAKLNENGYRMFCDEMFKFKIENLKDKINLGDIPVENHLILKKMTKKFQGSCKDSTYFKMYASYVDDLNNKKSNNLKIHLNKINPKSLNWPQSFPDVDDIELDSGITMGSRQEINFINLTRWEKDWNDCVAPITLTSSLSDFDKDAIYVIYPNHLLYPTYLNGEDGAYFFEINLLKKTESVVCILSEDDGLKLLRVKVQT